MLPREDLFVIILTLLATYFIFELNNGILMQAKELKANVTRLKRSRNSFRDDFLIPYGEDKKKSAINAVFGLYFIFFVCIVEYILLQGGILFYVSMAIFLFWIFFINFSLDIDELPTCRAVVESESMTEFLEQLNIRAGTDRFNKISELFTEASSSEKSAKEKAELMNKIFEELPF